MPGSTVQILLFIHHVRQSQSREVLLRPRLAQVVPISASSLLPPSCLGVHELGTTRAPVPPSSPPETATACMPQHTYGPFCFRRNRGRLFFVFSSESPASPVAAEERVVLPQRRVSTALATPRALPASPPPPNHDMRTPSQRASPPGHPELDERRRRPARRCTLTKTAERRERPSCRRAPGGHRDLGEAGCVHHALAPVERRADGARRPPGHGRPGEPRRARDVFFFVSVSPSRRRARRHLRRRGARPRARSRRRPRRAPPGRPAPRPPPPRIGARTGRRAR